MNICCKFLLVTLLTILALYVFLTFVHEFPENDRIQIQPLRSFDMLEYPSVQFDPFLHPSTKYLIDQQQMKTPEDIDVGDDGTIYAGLYDGRIIKISNEDIKTLEVIGKTQGQILGFQLSKDKKSLIFMASGVGIQKLNLKTRQLITILDEIDGVKMNTIAPNSIAEASNGDLYFTVSTDKYVMNKYIKQVVRSKPNGKLYLFNSTSKKTQLIIDGLYFANGIILEQGQKSVLVAESIMYRVQRIWVSGSKKGKAQTLIDNLPGMTDNIQVNQKGELWVPIVAWRSLLTEITYNTKFIRNIVVYFGIQEIFQKFADYSHVGGARVNTKTGKIVEWIVGSSKYMKFCTTLVQKNGKLYSGSLKSPVISIINLEEARKIAALNKKNQQSDL